MPARAWATPAAVASVALAALLALVAAETREQPAVAVALPLVLVAVPLMVLRPAVALAVLVIAQVASISDVAAAHGIRSVHVALLLLGGAAIVVGVRRGTVTLRWSPLMVWVAVFLASRALVALASLHPASSAAAVESTVKDLVFFLVVLALLGEPRRVRVAIGAAALTVVVLCALSVVQEFVFHNSTTFGGLSNVPLGHDLGSVTSRHSGPEADVNFWGRDLLLVLPLVAWSATRGRNRLHHVAGGCAVVTVLGGLYLTQSRGALLALGVTTVAWLSLAGPPYRKLLLALPVAAALLLLAPGVGTRLSTLTSADSATAGLEPSLAGRLGAQQVALQMFRDHPLTGVGPDGFAIDEPTYQREMGLLAGNTAPHNLYLQVLAEGGVVGLAGWGALLGGTMGIAVRSWRRTRLSAPGDHTRVLAASLISGLVGWSVASVFLHLSTFRTFLVVVALVGALDHRTKQLPLPVRTLAGHVPERAVRRGWSTAAAVLAVSGLIAAFGAGWSWWRSGAWVARARAEVVVAPSLDRSRVVAPGDPYQVAVLSRDSIVPTFLVIAQNPGFVDDVAGVLGVSSADRRNLHVTVDRVPGSAVLTVTARSGEQRLAAAAAAAVTSRAAAYVALNTPLYELQPLPLAASAPAWQRLHGERTALLEALALLAVAGAVVPARTPLRGRDR